MGIRTPKTQGFLGFSPKIKRARFEKRRSKLGANNRQERGESDPLRLKKGAMTGQRYIYWRGTEV